MIQQPILRRYRDEYMINYEMIDVAERRRLK